MSILGRCDGCATRDEMIALLVEQNREKEATILALVNTQAHRQRFPAPKAPPAPTAEKEPVLVTPEMQRSQVYTPPLGRDPYDVELDFEIEEGAAS